MTENCEFCGEPLDDGICQNMDCPQEFELPAMSESAEAFADYPDVTEGGGDRLAPALSTDEDFVPREDGPAFSKELDTTEANPAFSVSQELKGPFLTMEQAAIPVDHTGTIIFGGDFQLSSEIEPATRLTDDQNYRNIRTILKESFTADFDEFELNEMPKGQSLDTSKIKAPTDRPEVSQTIRLRNPFESERTVHRLPSRSLSVPSDSASLEKRKEQQEDYNLDSKDYKIVSKLGEGGSGVIYEAHQIALRRRVAVKVLKQRRSKQGSRSRTATKELEKRKARFLHEVNITAKLQHPNIIPLYDMGVNSRGEVFYAMKLIGENAEGAVQQSWASLVRTTLSDQTHQSIERNVQIFEKVCDAIRYAHAEQVVHRDLKPDNVMVGKFGEVLVIDWGMALDLSNGKEPFTAGGTTAYMPPEMGLHYLKQSEMHQVSQALMLTLEGSRREAFVETVLDHGNHFAAAELLQDDSMSAETHDLCRQLLKLDAQEKELALRINFSSDIYLLGAILYEIAVGHPPHYVPLSSCKNLEEKHHREFWLASNQRIQRLQQITDPLRLSLCNIALQALQANQKDRYRTVDDLQQALNEFKNQVQSLQLVEKGRSELKKAQGGDGYLHLLPALESFRGADTLFALGDEAQRLQIETACEYARRADRRKDFDAGLSILDEYVVAANRRNPEVLSLSNKLQAGKRAAARNRILAAVGWLAAVILPIGVWGASWLQTAQLRSDNVALELKKTTMETELGAKQSELVAKEATLKAANDQLAIKERDLQNVEMEVQQQRNELTSKELEINEKTAQLESKSSELIQASQQLTTKEQELGSKNQELVLAQSEISKVQQAVEQLQFESAEGLFNSLILPIPLDLRKGNLSAAASRLQALKSSQLGPQFKNDWVARHFAKTLNVSGVATHLGDNTTIIRVLHGLASELYVVGKQQDSLKLWKMDAQSGQSQLVPAELPTGGQVTDAAISADGKWLALALDDVRDEAQTFEPIWLLSLQTGKRVATPDVNQSNDDVVGCRALGFINNDQNTNQFQLVTVEELTAYRGLKQRLQMVTRTFEVAGAELRASITSRHPISATTRDDRRVNYLAAMSLDQPQPQIAIVYGSLGSRGEETIVLETLIAERGAAEFATTSEKLDLKQQSMQMDQFPSAMHVSQQGWLYCGYPDGRVDRHAGGQLTEEPNRSATEHESSVNVLATSAAGLLVSGGANGVLVVADAELNFVKRLVGQADGLTAVSIMNSGSGNTDSEAQNEPEDFGLQLASGGTQGYLRVWYPEGTTHDASIRKQELTPSSEAELRLGGNRTVTCGAVDRDWQAAEIPAAAYGTSDGQVFYFDSSAMRSRPSVPGISASTNGQASLVIPAPPGGFDTSFSNFESFGLVSNQFVLLQADGQLFSTTIADGNQVPGETFLSDLAVNKKGGGGRESRFVPLLASVDTQPIFFTNNPVNSRQVLVWYQAPGSERFEPVVADLNSNAQGGIKRLRCSPDGQWLAVVREADSTNRTGQYLIEILAVDSRLSADQVLRKVSETGEFRVGDPAFVGFSADSRELLFHFHKSGVDRETWIETWRRSGAEWVAAGQKQKIDDRRVDLLAWNGADKLITKMNKQFYVSRTDRDPIESQPYRPQVADDRLRSVLPGPAEMGQYVLFEQRLGLFDDQGQRDSAKPQLDLSNAREIKVFGDRAVVLDDSGFHLINEDLEYVTLIARRKITTTALSLAKDRLAVSYNVGGLCRIFDVSTRPATEIGKIADAKRVQISADGKWAACQTAKELQIYALESGFDQPSFVVPIAEKAWSAEWIGTDQPRLLVATQADQGTQLSWREIDPKTNAIEPPKLQFPEQLAGGNLREFQVAAMTQKYVALVSEQQGKRQLELWAVAAQAKPVSLSSMAGLRASELNPQSISFSEVSRENVTEIGTRLIVLDGADQEMTESQSATTRIFLLADEQLAAKPGQVLVAGEEPATTTIYRVFEIQGVLDVTDGRQLLGAEFSGDGRSLLEVDTRGVKLLLSKDW